MNPHPNPQLAASNRSQQIHTAIRDYILRTAGGESISRADFIASHSDLLPELEEELRKAELVRVAIKADAKSPPASDAATFRIRCPRCHVSTDVSSLEFENAVEDLSLTCGHCQYQFSLVTGRHDPSNELVMTTIGHFELHEEIGVGGFGSVWKAWDKELERWVAIKLPRNRHLNPTDSQQFLREAKAAARLHHPHIVSVHILPRWSIPRVSLPGRHDKDLGFESRPKQVRLSGT
jgi:hypothetical protein